MDATEFNQRPPADWNSPALQSLALRIAERLSAAQPPETDVLAGVLAAFGGNAAPAVPALAELLRRDVSEWRALRALQAIGGAALPAAPAVRQYFAGPGYHRSLAAAALIQIGDLDSLPSLRAWAATLHPFTINEFVQVEFREYGRTAYAAAPMYIALAEAPEFAHFRGYWITWVGASHLPGGPGLPALLRWLRDPAQAESRDCVLDALERALAVEPEPRPEWLTELNERGDATSACARDRRTPDLDWHPNWELVGSSPCFRCVDQPIDAEALRWLGAELDTLFAAGRPMEQNAALAALPLLGEAAAGSIPELLRRYLAAEDRWVRNR